MPNEIWIRRVLPSAQLAFRSNNRDVQAQLCAKGAGFAVLPRPLSNATPGILRLTVGENPPGRDTYVGYHRDLRRLPRMRALLSLRAVNSEKNVFGAYIDASLVFRTPAFFSTVSDTPVTLTGSRWASSGSL